MKKIIISIIIAVFANLVITAQEISVRKEKAYVYDITYTEVWAEDSASGKKINENIRLNLHLDNKAIDEVSKIIVSLDSLREEGNLTGRSVHYNIADRLLGWDAAINQRLENAPEGEKASLISEAKSNDKVKIDIETNMVGIDFGQISQASNEHILNIVLEYNDGSLSPPLTLGKKDFEKLEFTPTTIIDQKQ